MAICANCGANVPDGVQFCGECGAPMPPVQQPAQPVYGYRQAAQMQAQQAQQAQQGYGAPQGYGYGAPVMQPRAGLKDRAMNFFAGLKADPVKPVNRMLLRILSVVFAVGLLLLAIGIASGIYANRCFDESEYASSSGSTKAIITEYLRVGTNVKALRNADKSNSRLDAKRSYEKFSWDKTADTDNDKNIKTRLEEELDKVRENYGGFTWFMMKLGLLNPLFIWLGAIIAILSGCAWWILGGRIATLSENAVMPAIYGVLGFFALLLILCLILAPVYFRTYIRNISNIGGLYK